MRLVFHAATDTGLVRDHNEDNFLVDRNLQLFVVCDGMGGHAAGEVASAMTVNIVREDLLRNRDLLKSYEADDPRVSRRDLLAVLEQSVHRACYQVFERAQQNPEQRGMGTTICLLLVIGNRGFIAHVGDSRIYLVRQGQVHQLTEDHSLVNELLKQGRITSGGGVPLRYKNAVTRAVGVYESVEVDTLDFDMLPGDRFLLCTDGLHGYLSNERLLRLLEGSDHDVITQRLIKYANDKGGKDNITAIVVSVPEFDSDVDFDQVRKKLSTLKALALFKYLNYQELVKVVNIAIEKTIPSGQVIFREGDPEDTLYIILTGVVSILKKDVEVARLGEGTHFGEMALVDKAPRSADAIAATEVQALLVSRRDFYDLLRKNPSLAVKLLWSFLKVMSTRLRSTSDELTGLKSVHAGRHREDSEEAELPSSWLEAEAELLEEDDDDDLGPVTSSVTPSWMGAETITSAPPLLVSAPPPPPAAPLVAGTPEPPPTAALPLLTPIAHPLPVPPESRSVPAPAAPAPVVAPAPPAEPGEERTQPGIPMFDFPEDEDEVCTPVSEAAPDDGGPLHRDTVPEMPAFPLADEPRPVETLRTPGGRDGGDKG